MLAGHFVCIIECLGVSSASLLLSNLSLVSPSTTNSTIASGHTLGAWPSQLPWSTRVDSELTLESIRYGKIHHLLCGMLSAKV